MKVIRFDGSLPSSLKNGAITIGKFDGVHCAHATILNELIALSHRSGMPAVVFTFDSLPSAVIRPNFTPPLLCSLARRLELIEEFQADAVVLLPAVRSFFELSAEDFFKKLILEEFQARIVIEGDNFNFGKNRIGDIPMLRRLCQEQGIQLEIVPTQRRIFNGQELIVSSSRIRKLLKEGGIREARELLTRPYRITGAVIHGEQRGRLLGFPTANLEIPETIIPCFGVYAGRASWEEYSFPAAINIGANPTFGVNQLKIEVYLPGFSGDLYGKILNVDFYERIRSIVQFDSKEDLLRQMADDVQAVLKIDAEQKTRSYTK